jgi:hypothetical protein
MRKTNEIIRACSNGSIRIDTPDGVYYLSRREIRTLLFFGNMVLLRQAGGIIDSEATAYPHQNGEGIVIALSQRAYHITRSAFVLVAKGTHATSPMTPIPREG